MVEFLTKDGPKQGTVSVCSSVTLSDVEADISQPTAKPFTSKKMKRSMNYSSCDLPQEKGP